MTVIAQTGRSDIIQCDGCTAIGEAVEVRGVRGTLQMAFLPEGWTADATDAPATHLCHRCTAELHAPLRAAFEARFHQLGAGLVADIAASLGLPIMVARGWATELRS